jgi:hypothetical protein
MQPAVRPPAPGAPAQRSAAMLDFNYTLLIQFLNILILLLLLRTFLFKPG